jgi:cell division protein FtsB
MTTVDERQLDRLQSTARLLAIAILIVFVALIGYSAYRLRGIQGQIREGEVRLELQRRELREARGRKQALESEIAALDRKLAAMRELSTRIAEQSPGVLKRAAEETISENPEAAAELPRVFVHIGRDAQRPRAREISRRLAKAGFLMPGIENVGDRSPDRSQVRYFFDTAEAKLDVETLVEHLRQAGVSAEPTHVRHLEESIQKRRQYEIWFGEDFEP